MDKPPIIATCPTIMGIPAFENLRKVQQASFDPVCEVDYVGEEWSGWMESWTTQDKIVHGFERVHRERPDILSDGYIVLLHHDVVLEDPGVFWRLIDVMEEEQWAVAGPSENDGVMRNNFYGKHYCHSAFMVVNPRIVGEWWLVDKWIENGWVDKGKEYRLRGMDRYWKISHDNLGHILYLGSEWRFPRLGKATWVTFSGKPLATHLWLSTGDIRVHKGWRTIEGDDPVETARWREEFCRHYAEKHGVRLEDCETTVRCLDYYRCWGSEGGSGD